MDFINKEYEQCTFQAWEYMMPNSPTIKFLCLLALSSVLAACGGGDSTRTPTTNSSTLASSSLVTAFAGIEKTASFKIADNAYDALNAGAIKAFYFNRASIELPEANARIYKRAAGHADVTVYIHKSLDGVAAGIVAKKNAISLRGAYGKQ